MKLNWTVIPEPTRGELKKIARKMRRQGYVPNVEQYHQTWTVVGYRHGGGIWIA